MFYLRSDVDIRPLGLPGDLDAVGQGGGGREGPARAAVIGQMLISRLGKRNLSMFFVNAQFPLWGISGKLRQT